MADNTRAQSAREALQNPNVPRYLQALRQSEGADYDTLFGGKKFSDFAAHPNVVAEFTQTDGKKNRTTAAGGYQYLKKTWDDVSSTLGLTDFSPASQDLGAVELLRRSGSLSDVLAGNFDAAMQKDGGTWASLPSSKHPQGKRTPEQWAKFIQTDVPAVAPKANPSDSDDWWRLPGALPYPAVPDAGDQMKAEREARDRGKSGYVAGLIMNADRPEASYALTDARQSAAQAEQAKRDATGFSDVFGERRQDSRGQILFNILDKMTNAPETPPTDWPQQWAGMRDKVMAGRTDEERAYIQENVIGPESLSRVQGVLSLRREQDQTYARAGGIPGFLGIMAADAMDPVGFAAGMGAGKLMALGGVGSTALAAAGRRGAAVASFLGENALAGVSIEAMQDALGEVKGTQDYAMAFAASGLLSTPFAMGVSRSATNAAARELMEGIHTRALKEQAEGLAALQKETGLDGHALKTEFENRELAKVLGEVDSHRTIGPVEGVDTVLQSDIKNALEGKLPDEPKAEPTLTPEGEKVTPPVDENALKDPLVRQPDPAPDPVTVKEEVAKTVKGEGSVSREIPTKDGSTMRLDWNLIKTPEAQAGRFTVGEVLDGIKDRLSGPQAAMLKYLRKAASADVENVTVSFRSKTKAEFQPNGPRIIIEGENIRHADVKAHTDMLSDWHVGTVLHEVGHAMTHAKLRAHELGRLPDGPLKKSIDQLKDLHGRYVERVEQLFGDLKAEGASQKKYQNVYASQDLHEFASQFWSSPEVRDVLKGMEGKRVAGKTSNAWREAISTISKLLGLDKKDGVTEAGKLLDQIVSIPADDLAYSNGARALQAPSQVPPQVGNKANQDFGQRLFDQAKKYMSANPINRDRLKTMTARFGVESDGLVLAGSQNPLLQFWASLAIETTTRAAGSKATAVGRMTQLHKLFTQNSRIRYDSNMAEWMNAAGTTLHDKLIRGDAKRAFDKEVYTEIVNRRDPNFVSVKDSPVTRAADELEGVFERARVAQVKAGTLGSGNLPGNSRGYVPQALDGSKLANLSTMDQHLVAQHIALQLQSRLNWSKSLADTFAPYYLDRVRKRALGSKGVDSLSAGGDGTTVIRETLDEMVQGRGMTPQMMGEASTASSGLGQTKKRLDFDLNAEVRPGFKLMDVYVQDPALLAMTYARRTAGTVALTEKGVHGIQGVRLFEDALLRKFEDGTQATLREIEAFRRTAAELLGTPVPGAKDSVAASNLGLIVSAQRLGGMALTQFQEAWNGIHMLGLQSTLSGIAQLPKMAGEVRRLKKGNPAQNSILDSIDFMYGEIGTEHYKMIMPMDPPDARLEQYMEQSGLFTRLVRQGSHLQSKISFFRGLLSAQHRAVSEQIVMKSLRFIRDGGEDIALRDMGFTPELAKAMKGDLPTIATWGPDGRLASFDISKVSDPRIGEAFAQAVERGASQIIQGSTIGEKSKWMHNDYLKLLLQLRTFGLTASEKQWSRTVMQGAEMTGSQAAGYARAAGLLVAQMALALPLHYARVQSQALGRGDRDQYLEDNLHPAALTRALMNYSSLSGVTSDVMEQLANLAGGWAGEETKDMLGVRNAGGSSSVGRLVPVAGSVDSAMKVLSGRSDLHTAIKQLPFSNIFYLAPIINLTKKDG